MADTEKKYLNSEGLGVYDENIKNLINDKVSIQQDVADSGKILGVGTDGKITPVNITWGQLCGNVTV